MNEVVKCSHCQSEKVIPQAKVLDGWRNSPGQLALLVGLGDPNALLLDEPIGGFIRANVCCDCGAVDLVVENPQELWEGFCKMPEQKRP